MLKCENYLLFSVLFYCKLNIFGIFFNGMTAITVLCCANLLFSIKNVIDIIENYE